MTIQTDQEPFSSSPVPSLVKTIENHFAYQAWRQIKTVVAVSGGPDSVALLRGLLCLAERNGDCRPKNLIVAHVDHGLRGSESTGDAQFVEALATKLGLEFVLANSIGFEQIQNQVAGSLTAEPETAKNSPSPSEESLRDFRYENLLATATRIGARYVVTGHNLNDQIETILFRIFRGTGIAGLAGIPAVRLGNGSVTIVRPLLKVRRSEIEAYLSEIDQDFRVDSSNSNSKYQRNYLRNELIPLIESRFGPGIEQALLRLGCQAEQANEFISSQSKSLDQAIVRASPNSVELDCSKLIDQPPILIRQFLVDLWIKQTWPRQSMGFEWWEKLSAAIVVERSGNRVLNLPGAIRFSRKADLATFLKD